MFQHNGSLPLPTQVFRKQPNVHPKELNHILLSGCKPYEYSYEAVVDGKIRGLMTWAFIKTTQKRKTWSEAILNVRKKVVKQQPGQHPLLAGKPALRKELIFN